MSAGENRIRRGKLRPGSLRSQLLARSLLILSVLLLLIGGLQYWLNRDFVYSSRAEAMQAQMRAIPPFLYSAAAGFSTGTDGSQLPGEADNGGEPSPSEAGNGAAPSSGEAGNGAAPNSGEAGNSAEPKSGEGRDAPGAGRSLPRGGERRPLLLDPHTTLAVIGPDGSFTDLREETLAGALAPRLDAAAYAQLLAVPSGSVRGEYRIVAGADGSEQLAVFMKLGGREHPQGLLQMSVDAGPLRDLVIRQLLIFAGLSLAALLGGLLLYIPVLRRTLVPLSNMGRAAGLIDAGNLDARFPVDQGQAEIDRLSRSFNGMLERLEDSFRSEREAKEQMRRFAADASHELRTPLTSIHGFLEVLLRGAADNREQLYAALNSMHGESKRINKLVEDLLLLTRMDGAPQLALAELPLGELIADMRPQLTLLAGSRRLTFDLAAGIRGRYDADKIKQIVLNLVHNAIQHTDPDQGEIRISLQAEESKAVLTVSDNGPGIAPEHLPHLFRRFYRSDSSRTRKYGGSGLGLSITRSIAEAHGGHAEALSPPGGGAVFRITFPCELIGDRKALR
ncbi:sensor histidine kinase [Paenibacillus sp. CN-4]|uniref:sensor histidine kinase n=1 Tax=Paenibacillus nanchangensis TaxID=3348343 RepID=UPI00397B83FB